MKQKAQPYGWAAPSCPPQGIAQPATLKDADEATRPGNHRNPMILSLKSSLSMAAFAVVLALCFGPVHAQKAEDIKKLQNDVASLKGDMQALTTKQQQILDQLGEIKKMLEKPNAAANPEAFQLPHPTTPNKDPVLPKPHPRRATYTSTH